METLSSPQKEELASILAEKDSPLNQRQTQVITEFLSAELYTMGNVGKGSVMSAPGGNVVARFGGVDEFTTSLIKQAWERLSSASEVHANPQAVADMLFIWMTARHAPDGSTIAYHFLEPNVKAVINVLSSQDAEKNLPQESSLAFIDEYRKSVLLYIQNPNSYTGARIFNIDDFPASKTASFINGYVSSPSANPTGLSLVLEAGLSDEDLHLTVPTILQNCLSRLKITLDQQDSEQILQLLDILSNGSEISGKKQERAVAKLLKETSLFLMDNLPQFPTNIVTFDSPQDAALRFLASHFELLPKNRQKQLLEDIQDELQKKLQQGFKSPGELQQTGRMAEFLFQNRWFLDREHYAQLLADQKPFIASYFEAYRRFLDENPSSESVRHLNDQGLLLYNLKSGLKFSPEYYLPDITFYLSGLYPNGKIDDIHILTTISKKVPLGKFIEIAMPFISRAIEPNIYDHSETSRLSEVESGIRNIYKNLSDEEESRKFTNLCLWLTDTLNTRRERFDRAPEDLREEYARNFNTFQSVIRGLIRTFSNDADVSSRLPFLQKFLSKLDGQAAIASISTSDENKIKTIRTAMLETLEGKGITVEDYIQTDEGIKLIAQI